MQVLTLLPGGEEDQLQALPALAVLGEQQSAQLHVVCPAQAANIWTLLPAVEHCIPFAFGQRWSLADWTNLLGNVREPDFQVSLNLSTDWSIDLLLSLSHIPIRVASGGFSATEQVKQQLTGWRGQALEAWLQPLGVHCNANAYRLPLPQTALAEARASLPRGDGPVLLLAPDAIPGWSPEDWGECVEAVSRAVPSVRLLWLGQGEGPAGVQRCQAATVMAEAATVASVDVVLTDEPRLAQLAVLTGTALVAAGMADPRRLPQRDTIKPLPPLNQLRPTDVLQALGA